MKYIRRIKLNILTPFKTVSVSDAPNLKRFFDSVGFGDALFSDLNKLLQDGVSISEKEIRDMSKLVRDVVTADDEITVEIDFRRLFQDSVEFSDIETLHPGLGKNDAVSLTDSREVVASFNRNLYDSLGFIHRLAKSSTKLLQPEQVNLSDTISKTVVYFRAADDSFVMSEEIATKNTGKNFSDIVTCTDSFGRVVVFNRTLDDVFSFQHKLSSNIEKILQSFVTLTDGISISSADREYEWLDISDKALLNPEKFLFHDFSLDDYITGKAAEKLLREEIAFSEEFIRIATFFRLIQDSVELLDQPLKNLVTGRQDSVDASTEDAFVAVGDYFDPQYADPDLIAGIVAYIKTVSDSLSMADVVLRTAGKTLNSSASILDSGGQSIINSYMDSQYISENYIGSLNTF